MSEKEILQELIRIRDGIECDRFTWENINDLINEIKERGK